MTILAQATVDGAIDLRAGDSELRVEAGKPFTVRLHYKVYEASLQEESWRFRLTARLEGEEEAVSEVLHLDRRVFRDDVWSNIRQDHVCPEPGEYVLRFVAEVEMACRPWGELQDHRVEREELRGTVRIIAS